LLFDGRVYLIIETSGGAERCFLFLIFGLLAGINWDFRLAGGSVAFFGSLLFTDFKIDNAFLLQENTSFWSQ